MKICERCGKEHDGSFGTGRFCSKSCACNPKHTEHSKEVMSQSLKAYYEVNPKIHPTKLCPRCGRNIATCNYAKHTNVCKGPRTPSISIKNFEQVDGKYKCPHCGKLYSKAGIATHVWRTHGEGSNFQPLAEHKKINPDYVPYNKGKTAATDDSIRRRVASYRATLKVRYPLGIPRTDKFRQILSDSAKRQGFGGYNSHCSRGKKGWYKGIWCDSSWELAFVIWCLDGGKDIKRNAQAFPYMIQDKVRNYYPDFLVDGELVEIKGYVSPITFTKISSVPRPVKLYSRLELQHVFDYIAQHYGKVVDRNIHELYDKPV